MFIQYITSDTVKQVLLSPTCATILNTSIVHSLVANVTIPVSLMRSSHWGVRSVDEILFMMLLEDDDENPTELF